VQPTLRSDSLQLPPARDAGLLLVALAGVSASGPLMAATAAPALAIAFWRTGLGAGFTAILTVLRQPGRVRAVTASGWRLSALAGVLLALHFGTWVPSVKYTSVASATGLVATQAIFTALMAAVAGHRLPSRAWFGIALAFLGTLLVAGADLDVSTRALFGDGLAVLGGLFAAAYVTVGGQARRQLSTAVYTSICYAVCSAGLLVACLLGHQAISGYPPRAWLYLIAVTGAAQLLGHSLINVVLRSASPTFVSLAILLEVPGAGLIAFFWLHQHPSRWAYAGLVLLFAGLLLVVRTGSRPPDID